MSPNFCPLLENAPVSSLVISFCNKNNNSGNENDNSGTNYLSRRDCMLVENDPPHNDYCPVGTKCDAAFHITSLRDDVVIGGFTFYQHLVPNGTLIHYTFHLFYQHYVPNGTSRHCCAPFQLLFMHLSQFVRSITVAALITHSQLATRNSRLATRNYFPKI